MNGEGMLFLSHNFFNIKVNFIVISLFILGKNDILIYCGFIDFCWVSSFMDWQTL